MINLCSMNLFTGECLNSSTVLYDSLNKIPNTNGFLAGATYGQLLSVCMISTGIMFLILLILNLRLKK